LLNPLGLNEHWSRPSPDPVGRRGRGCRPCVSSRCGHPV